MFRSAIAAVLLSTLSVSAQDLTDISARIATGGLAATAESLANPTTATDRFALGGVMFLRAIERSLQTRWQHGITAAAGHLPVLHLPVPANPDPKSFRPEIVEDIFIDLTKDLAKARAPLRDITDSDDVKLTISLGDRWFDIDMNGTRSESEGLMKVAGSSLGLRGVVVATAAPTIQFDTADAAWLAAYTHLLGAIGELVIAFNPSPQIARVMDSSKAMNALAADTEYANAFDMQFGTEIDLAAMLYFALQQQPNPMHTRTARKHLLDMVAQNRVFWNRATQETDNFAEWIPNATQTSALGLTLPPDTGPRWLAVISDAEDLLEGRKLIPFWRLRKGAGINLKRLLQDPVPVNAAEWFHGIGLLPFAEEGERVSSESWWQFQEIARGDAALFAIWLN